MGFRRNKFRILLPVLYVALTALPLVGLILTIAEGPTPFGYLLAPSYPGFFLVQVLSRFLMLPESYGLFLMLVGLLVNLGIYYLAGYLIDLLLIRRSSS